MTPVESAIGTRSAWFDEGDADDLEVDQLRNLVEWLPVDLDVTHFDVAETQAAVSAAALTTELVVERLPPHPAVAALAAALPDEGVRLLASLTMAGPGPEIDRAAALRPLLALLDIVGDGVKLTPTGLMKQASVRVLLERLGWGGDWVFGRSLREDNLPPVHWLRHAAHALHLVRRHKGRLVLTVSGREIDGDAGRSCGSTSSPTCPRATPPRRGWPGRSGCSPCVLDARPTGCTTVTLRSSSG